MQNHQGRMRAALGQAEGGGRLTCASAGLYILIV